jgi:hypothetical protein
MVVITNDGNGKEMICLRNTRLDIKGSDTADEATVGGYTNTGSPNQQWSFGTIRAFFFILNKKSGRVLDATSK